MDWNLISLLPSQVWESLYMTVISAAVAYIIGLPLGVILVITDKGGIRPMRAVNQVLGFVVNFFRSVPFLILMIVLSGFTRLIAGKAYGSAATIIPLIIGSAPFVARMVESSLKEVDPGVVEAAQAMGASTWQIISKVILPEAKPSLIVGAAISVTTILGYSAMAGAVGAGGLGAWAINYGYYRGDTAVMWVAVILLVIIVQVFQAIGMRLAKILDRRLH